MRTIFKYPIPFPMDDLVQIGVIPGGRVLHAGVQGSQLYAWALVDTDREREGRETINLYVVGTGRELPPGAQVHHGTVQIGPYVWHIFGEKPPTQRTH